MYLTGYQPTVTGSETDPLPNWFVPNTVMLISA